MLFIYNYLYFDIPLIWIMKLNLHSSINNKNAHNVVTCKGIIMTVNFITVKKIRFLDIRFSSLVLCLLDFESGSQHPDKLSTKTTIHLDL